MLDAANDAFAAPLGVNPVIEAWSGPPASLASSPPSGTRLAVGTLPTVFWSASVSGVKVKLGSWVMTSTATGDIGCWRIIEPISGFCKMTGDATDSNGTGSMLLDNVNVSTIGQVITVIKFNQELEGLT